MIHSMKQHTYIAIDLKSFYASVECQERGLNPLTTNLVVADVSRTEKTICLAVSPALKAYGIGGRSRLFEVVQKVNEINRERSRKIGWKSFTSASIDARELIDPNLELTYLAAPPRMATYISYSSKIYNIYLRYIAKEDIHVYSIDEVFIDATSYLKYYGKTAHDFAKFLIQQIMKETGITATAGIGENLFLCKCAMDIVAKHIPADKDGVRIAELTVQKFRRVLWNHRPLTDFWRIGRGIAKKLEAEGIYTMGDIARCSIGDFSEYYNEDLLYRLFGIQAELLIDHAWGYEPCTMKDIKSYKPSSNSVSVGQVLSRPYTYEETQLIIKEMCEELSLKLVKNHKNTDEIVLYVGYDASMIDEYDGEICVDYYGRLVPKSFHASCRLDVRTASSTQFRKMAMKLFVGNVRKNMKFRRINLSAIHIKDDTYQKTMVKSISLFDSKILNHEEEKTDAREKQVAEAILKIQQKYGKNAVIRGMDLSDGATTKQRNEQIGGHKA